MPVYLVLGFFIGLFFGSWGCFLLAPDEGKGHGRASGLRTSRGDGGEVSAPDGKETDAEAAKAIEKWMEGVSNMLTYDGKPHAGEGERS